jgi:ferredoxin-thioredoxin reductase catalytic subunit
MGDMETAEIQKLYERLKKEAEDAGYHLNPDKTFASELARSLIVNEKRYGYWACPCRLAAGKKEEDLDIICPCDYRDADIDEFGACYCALYVSEKVVKGEMVLQSIPERRPSWEKRRRSGEIIQKIPKSLPYPVWRCKVCGYLCARDGPPEVCPICKAKKDRFEKFLK